MTETSTEIPNRSAAGPSKEKAPNFAIGKHVFFGSALMALLVFGIGGWAAKANLSGAIMAPGTVVVDRNVKKLQHRDGGIVEQINVRNGDRVNAGQVLLRLDPTQTQAELSIISSQLIDLTARGARLRAESVGQDTVSLPESLREMRPDVAAAVEGERRLFELNKENNKSRVDQLELRIEQLNDEISGLVVQRDAKQGELKLITLELKQVRLLHDKKLTPVSRVYAMEREEKRLGGELGSLIAQIARVKGQIGEIKLQVLAIDQTARTQAQHELRTIEAKIAELKEREVASHDRLNRIDLRAPQAGIVHELAVHTIGGVISPAEQIMLIVPDHEDLTIEARFAPTDIDQVRIGSLARLRLSAFDLQTTPEFDGRVVQVSADVTLDSQTGQQYYVGRIDMKDKSQRTVGDLELVPGMPVEVFISTGERTALSYLMKPFTDQMTRALRE